MHQRIARCGALLLACVAFTFVLAVPDIQMHAHGEQGASSATASTYTVPSTPSETVPEKQRMRNARDAYIAGAKRLERDDLNGAEREFARALQLDPDNREYAVALSVAREHRLTELVQKASKASFTGAPRAAEALLAEARAIDPENPMVMEHRSSGSPNDSLSQTSTVASRAENFTESNGTTPLTDRARLLSAGESRESWRAVLPNLAGPIHVRPAEELKSFHLRGDSQQLLRSVAEAYGVRVVFDDSVDHKSTRFDMDDVSYQPALPVLMKMLHVFAVPIDETSILIAKDDTANRDRLERLMEETILFPGFTVEQINDMGNLMRTIFDLRQVSVEPTLETIVVRAPEAVLAPMNRTLHDLMEGSGEILLEAKLYEISTTHTRDIGATIPTQAGIYNVEAAATSLVNSNQTLVQQAIAQGFVSSTASNIEIALALIGSGLVQSSLLSSTIGFFGHGLTETGITASTNTSFKLALNATDTRALDDVQMRVDDRQVATFRAGTRYPVTTSTYTTGLSTAASALSNAKINGVSVASLLAQYAGGSSATIPQVTYEDLGVTLRATPTIQKSGRINLNLDMKIEALAGGTLDGNPILANRQFTSDITVGEGETAMLVSNLNRTESAAVTGIPGLSELPGFQAPVDQNAEKDTGQLIVLITPHVVRRRSNMVSGPRIVIQQPQAAGGLTSTTAF